MDVFGCYDYKRPISATDPDWRTSQYRGHRHITDLRLENKLNAKFSDKGIYVRDPLLSEKPLTDCTANYVWKYGNPDILKNPSLNMKQQFLKPYDESHLLFIKRKMKPVISVSQEAFVHKQIPEEQEVLPIRHPTPVEITKLVIDPAQEGFTKYVDSSATTYKLSYVRYAPSELRGGISASDNITFWNWEKLRGPTKKVSRVPDAQMCDEGAANRCTKRRCEFQCELKRVPHSGMVSEVGQNFTDPRLRTVEFDPEVKPKLVYAEVIPFATKSEYAIYGSGERVRQYV
ncbi:hypothetical protein KR018_003217 [Drosophila ironensis]|nr:hypothetical protein KR018_003217 [Drosophila ironensis]